MWKSKHIFILKGKMITNFKENKYLSREIYSFTFLVMWHIWNIPFISIFCYFFKYIKLIFVFIVKKII